MQTQQDEEEEEKKREDGTRQDKNDNYEKNKVLTEANM
jgi:hypothetical protein